MGILKNVTDEYFGETVREGEGAKVKIDGEEYVLLYEHYPFANKLEPMDDEGDHFVEFRSPYYGDRKMYIGQTLEEGTHDNKVPVYYIMPEKSLKDAVRKVIGGGCIKKTVISYDGYDPFEDSLLPLHILSLGLGHKDTDIIDFDKPFTVIKTYNGYLAENENSYNIYITEEAAEETAISQALEFFETEGDDGMETSEVERLKRIVGDSWILMDNIKDVYRELRVSSYVDGEDMSEDEANEVVDNEMEDDDTDFLKELTDEMGYLPKECYDIDALAKLCVDCDGRANYLSSYDGEEYYCEIDGTEYYIYIN